MTASAPNRPNVLLWGVLALLACVGSYFLGQGSADGEDTTSVDAVGQTIDRRLDPAAGCDALAAGIRTVVRGEDTGLPPEVRAVLLDGLLLNYRNMECGILNRSRLLLEIVGTGPPLPPYSLP